MRKDKQEENPQVNILGKHLLSSPKLSNEMTESIKNESAVSNIETKTPTSKSQPMLGKEEKNIEYLHHSDEDRRVAAQMAAVAVAAAAATHDTSSPSITASYAKDLSASILIYPTSRKKSRIPIHLYSVKKEIQKRLMLNDLKAMGIEEYRDTLSVNSRRISFSKQKSIPTTQFIPHLLEDKSISNDIAKKKNDVVNHVVDNKSTEIKYCFDQVLKKGKPLLFSPEYHFNNISTTVQNREYKQKSETCETSSISLQFSKTSQFSQGDNISIKFFLQKRIAYGRNDFFLKHLLMLCFYTCSNSDKDINKIDNINHSRKVDDIYLDLISDIDVGRTIAAVDNVLSTLDEIKSLYELLVDMLPLTNINQLQSEEDEIKPRLVVPDLLPPFTSLSSDATAAFFQACSSSLTDNAISENVSNMRESHGNIANPPTLLESTQVSRSDILQSPGPSSFVSALLSSVTGKIPNTSTLTSAQRYNAFVRVFGKVRRTRRQKSSNSLPYTRKEPKNNVEDITPTRELTPNRSHLITEHEKINEFSPGYEYVVMINHEMLGLTVENILERTVVRTVLSGGAAKKAGAKVGSLIVKVGNVETANLTHFETIDELRHSQRPLKLVLRCISKEALRGAREEMGRLIRGRSFGMLDINSLSNPIRIITSDDKHDRHHDPMYGSFNNNKFLKLLHVQWFEGTQTMMKSQPLTKKDESLSKAGEKLVWILSLLVLGLEVEAAKHSNGQFYNQKALSTFDRKGISSGSDKFYKNSNTSLHKASDYSDAAKSVSKILHDYVTKHLDQENNLPVGAVGNSIYNRKNSKESPLWQKSALLRNKSISGQNFVTSNSSKSLQHSESALLWIGDVLHRTRGFLADPLSPPAVLLRGEVIALLCDILDIDTEMALSEEESTSTLDRHKAGPITDLGSAGSLLKLIVLNCSISKSSDYENTKYVKGNHVDIRWHTIHASNRFLAVVHRLAASHSTSARVTACSLSPVLWAHLDFAHQLQLRGVITRALHDVEVVVRKSTANVLHEIAELVFDPRAVPWLVLMCERAMSDLEPQLRSAAMTLTLHLAEHLPNAFLVDASKGSRSLRRLPLRTDPSFAEVYLLQCKLLPVATQLAEDRSPSVRLAVAAQCDRLSIALGEHWHSVIIDILQALLGDPNERVRSEAALCVPRLVESVLIGTFSNVSPNMSSSVLESLLPVTINLLNDPGLSVRMSLATASGELLTLLVGLQSIEDICAINGVILNIDHSAGIYKRHKRHVDETLIPLLQKLLHDTNPEVTSAALRAVTNASRGNGREISSRRKEHGSNAQYEHENASLSLHHPDGVEKKEPVFIPVLSEQQALRLLPTLSELANSAQWRVRQSAVEIVPALLGCTHCLETRFEISQLCVKLMNDSVDVVRKSAAECLCLGGYNLGGHRSIDGGEWITEIVLPQLHACRDSADSKQRLLSLKMVDILLTNGVCTTTKEAVDSVTTFDCRSDKLSLAPIRRILEISASLSNDKIANVRLNFGRIFSKILSINALGVNDVTYINHVLLDQLSNEISRPLGGDRDVIYFATNACKVAQNFIDLLPPSPNHDRPPISLVDKS